MGWGAPSWGAPPAQCVSEGKCPGAGALPPKLLSRQYHAGTPACHHLCAAGATALPQPEEHPCPLPWGSLEPWHCLRSPRSGTGWTPAGFVGRGSSSAAALALCCLHKAFLQRAGSHPWHGAGNYRPLGEPALETAQLPSRSPSAACPVQGGCQLRAGNTKHEAARARGGRGGPAPCHPVLPPRFGPAHNSLMRMSGTQMLSAGREICVRLSKRAGSHLRNSSVQCWERGRAGDLGARSPPPRQDPNPGQPPVTEPIVSAMVGARKATSSGHAPPHGVKLGARKLRLEVHAPQRSCCLAG